MDKLEEIRFKVVFLDRLITGLTGSDEVRARTKSMSVDLKIRLMVAYSPDAYVKYLMSGKLPENGE
jgi:hypothetical protein